MSVRLTLQAIMTAVEVLEGNAASAVEERRTWTHDQFNLTQELDGTTAVPVSKCAYFDAALVGGAKSIDLSALTGANAVSVVGTGLKAQALLLLNPSTNENSLTFTAGEANGYAVAGADWKLTLQPGQWALLFLNDLAPDVAVDAKTIDIAGTGTEVARMAVILG